MKPAEARLRSFVDGVVRLGPETLHIDVTNSCNTDCITCWDHSPLLDRPQPTAWKRQRADTGRIRALLDDVQSLGGLKAIIVSGMGEPFTHPQIYELLADLKRRGLHVTVITNLVAADVERILELGVDDLLIGIHGASERAYLDFHPSFSSAQWRRLQGMLERFKVAHRRFKHVHVICACNVSELTAMIEQAHRLDAAQVNFKLASLHHGTERARISDEQRTGLLEVLIPDARERARDLDVKHNLDVLELQARTGGEATAPIADVGCFIGYHYSRVTVDGTVLFCCNTEIPVGRLDDARFGELWTGAAWSSLRERLRDGRYFPGCAQCGKFNQNVKLSERFRRIFGEAAWLDVTGRGGAARALPSLRVLP